MHLRIRPNRESKLTSQRHRRELADGLRRTVKAAESPPRPLSSAVPVQRRAVLAARGQIERLAEDLVETGDVQPRGIVLVETLLTDGTSPLYCPGPEAELDLAVRHARAALLLR